MGSSRSEESDMLDCDNVKEKSKASRSITFIFGLISLGSSIHQWSGRPGFNPRSSHTKDLINGT